MRNLVWQPVIPGEGWRFWVGFGLVLAISLAIGVLPREITLALTLGTGILLLTTLRPLFGLYLVILAIPWGSILEFRLGVIGFAAAEVLAGWLILLWLVGMAMRRHLILPRASLLMPLALFLMIIALSIGTAFSLQYSLKGFLLWVEFAAIYLLVGAKVGVKDIRGLIYVTLVAAGGQALLGGYQFLTGTGPASFQILGGLSRAYGSFAQPNPYGGYLAMTIPLTLSLGLAPGLKFAKHLPARIMILTATGLLLVALAFSWSRGAWLAGGLALLAVAILGILSKAFEPRILAVYVGLPAFVLSAILFAGQNVPLFLALLAGALVGWGGGALVYLGVRHRWVVPLVLLSCFLLVIFSALGFGSLVPEEAVARLLDLPTLDLGDVRFIPVSDENFAVLERLAHWQAALAMLSEHPLLGVGIGNYVPVYPRYALPGWDDPLGHAHNYYLNIAAESGLAGLLAYLFFWAIALVQGIRLLFKVPLHWRGIVLGILGMMVALSIHNLVDNLYVQGINLQVAIFLGMLAVLERGVVRPSS